MEKPNLAVSCLRTFSTHKTCLGPIFGKPNLEGIMSSLVGLDHLFLEWHKNNDPVSIFCRPVPFDVVVATVLINMMTTVIINICCGGETGTKKVDVLVVADCVMMKSGHNSDETQYQNWIEYPN
jgi:hypothetical protein